APHDVRRRFAVSGGRGGRGPGAGRLRSAVPSRHHSPPEIAADEDDGGDLWLEQRLSLALHP
ncbi:hypothetical protein, partial [Nonomuraea sp. NPDC005730]|uniref:hypothetical protein n=1 Tax=Nonomuraea sp. NPDC005730 TaxID=3157055 RepID=UPI0033F50B53